MHILLAYLIGSIPFGLLLTRAAGLGDIRKVGSGNIGATNVLRTGRKGLAAATLLLDGLKGVVAVLLLPPPGPAAIAVVVGHCFPVWLRFRGGKGVATGLGALIGLDWRLGAICCAVWLLVVALTRRSSAGALAAFLAAPFVKIALVAPIPLWAPSAIALLVWIRHRANIARLIAGTEPRVGGKA
jgi:glycerol-3-phosphate acyltransferase PlsY